MKLFPFATLVFSFLFFACRGENNGTAEVPGSSSDTLTTEEVPSPVAFTDIGGVYTTGYHDASWAVLVEKKDNEWSVRAAEWEGMLPPGSLLEHVDDLPFQPFTDFSFDGAKGTFNSDWGAGYFNEEGMVFSDKEGLNFTEEEEEAGGLLLYRRSRK